MKKAMLLHSPLSCPELTHSKKEILPLLSEFVIFSLTAKTGIFLSFLCSVLQNFLQVYQSPRFFFLPKQ